MARFLGRANRILDSEGDLALFIELYCPFPVTDDQLRSLLRDYLHSGKVCISHLLAEFTTLCIVSSELRI